MAPQLCSSLSLAFEMFGPARYLPTETSHCLAFVSLRGPTDHDGHFVRILCAFIICIIIVVVVSDFN